MEKNQLTKEQKQKIKPLIQFSGLIFMALGFYAYFATENVSDFLDLGMEDVKILSYALIGVGIIDFIIATTLFGYKDRV